MTTVNPSDAHNENISASDDVQSSLLEAILFLMPDEQRKQFLANATASGVLYANRLPSYSAPLSIRLSRRARETLHAMQSLGDDPVEALRIDLERGVRFSPPPAGWFQTRENEKGMPIRIESRQFGVPCKLDRDRLGKPFLLATYVGRPDDKRSSEDSISEDFSITAPAELEEPVDDAHIDTDVIKDTGTQGEEFHPHVVTSWTIAQSTEEPLPPVDAQAIESLVLQISTNRRYAGFIRNARRRCDELAALVHLERIAGQLEYRVVSRDINRLELELKKPASVLRDCKRLQVFVEHPDTKERRTVRTTLVPESFRANRLSVVAAEGSSTLDVPDCGYLMDSGQASQLKKQLEAISDISHPNGRAHVMRLVSLLGSRDEMRLPANHWDRERITFCDERLDDRQREAVKKALTTPDVCLIQGPPGTGKTRVISEIVRQATKQGLKVLLAAPTHVAVDNVLEKIGLIDDVSPVRCVRDEKKDDLDEHIQLFTYENRASLLANESRNLVRRDVEQLEHWKKWLEAAQTTIGSLRSLLNEHDEYWGLRASLVQKRTSVERDVRAEFANETDGLRTSREHAEQQVAAAKRDVEDSRASELSAAARHADVATGLFSPGDQSDLGDIHATVMESHRDAVDGAGKRVHESKQRLDAIRASLLSVENQATSCRSILSDLSHGVVPAIVQQAIDNAVSIVRETHLRRIRDQEEVLLQRSKELKTSRRRAAVLRKQIDMLSGRSASLIEATGQPLYRRALYGAWWGSFVQDYSAQLAVSKKKQQELREHIASQRKQRRLAEMQLRESKQNQSDAMREEALESLKRETSSYRDRLAKHEEELATLRDELPREDVELKHRQQELVDRTRDRSIALEQATEAFHRELVATAKVELEASLNRATKARSELKQCEAHLAQCVAASATHAERIEEAIGERRSALDISISDADQSLSAIRQKSASIIEELQRPRHPSPTFDHDSISSFEQRCSKELGFIGQHLAFGREWHGYLEREAPHLADRLAEYVNLVCATTMGIATDVYFGDKGQFEEKEFDLLIIDEAGKVTEPEFLVAASRAKRWVLVGDHKQLPPFYDQILDPFIAEANRRRKEANLPELDEGALRTSCFERLWNRLLPAATSHTVMTAPTEQSNWLPGVDSLSSTDDAFQVHEEMNAMYDQHRDETFAWKQKQSADMRRDYDLQQAASEAGWNVPASEGSVARRSPEPPGRDRCVTLTIQRRMHPDLAIFISDVFYDGQYHSPRGGNGTLDAKFVAEKTLALSDFGKPVTFVEVAASRGDVDGEFDLSQGIGRQNSLYRYAANLPRQGYANLDEARKVVSILEALVDDPEITREQATISDNGRSEPVIGVIAFYAGQVALIRRLIIESGELRAEATGVDFVCRGIRVVVNSVDAFQGKECSVIIASFTRSNRRKAVGFVDDPHRLNVALSRSQKKLILVGDSGTLTRRAQRDKEIEAKDSAAAERERAIFTALVDYVANKGKHMRVFERR